MIKISEERIDESSTKFKDLNIFVEGLVSELVNKVDY